MEYWERWNRSRNQPSSCELSLSLLSLTVVGILNVFFSVSHTFRCQFAWKVSVPRPVARISVTIAALAVSLFVLKSFLSTAFFVVVCF